MAFKPIIPATFIEPITQSLTGKITHTQVHNGVQISSKQEIAEGKQRLLNMVNLASAKWLKNLEKNQVQLDSTLDLDRLVKAFLVLSGEASEIVGASSSTTAEMESRLTLSKAEEILDENDPEVAALFEKIYERYNQMNDAEAEGK